MNWSQITGRALKGRLRRVRINRWAPMLGAAALLAVAVSSTTFASGEGKPIDGGNRNPSNNQSTAYTSETEILTENGTYGTRQSNKKDGDGGGAIYGCRSEPGKEPCVRANNLKNGRAFEFNTVNGNEGGQIEVGGTNVNTNAVPFTTNAAGRVANFNADKVDGLDAADIRPMFAVVATDGALGRNNGATASSQGGTGEYSVTFSRDVSKCAYQATIAEAGTTQPPAGQIGAAAGGTANSVMVVARDTDGTKAAKPFHLTIDC